MSYNKRRSSLPRLLIVLAIISSFIVVPVKSTGLAQKSPPFVRMARDIEAGATGLTNPVGLAFSHRAGKFLAVEGQSPGQSAAPGLDIIYLNSFGEREASVHIPAVAADPVIGSIGISGR